MNQILPRRQLSPAQAAIRAAHQIRSTLRICPTEPVDPFYIAEQLGIEVRLVDVPKLDGLYLRTPERIILLSCLRPQVRQTFSCAHEIAHDVLGHSASYAVTEGSLQRLGPVEVQAERQADVFAGMLLMPALAVRAALTTMKLTAASIQSEHLYALACAFGVGYETCASHLCHGLKLLSIDRKEQLLKARLPALRSRIAGIEVHSQLTVVNPILPQRPIDIEVGDSVFSPIQITRDGTALGDAQPTPKGWLFTAIGPGIVQVTSENPPWAGFVRVRRSGFTGRALFRHLEDSE